MSLSDPATLVLLAFAVPGVVVLAIAIGAGFLLWRLLREKH